MTIHTPTFPMCSILIWLSPTSLMFLVFNLPSKEIMGSWSEKGDGPSHSPPLSLVSEERGGDHTHPYLSTDSFVTCPQQRHWGHNLTREMMRAIASPLSILLGLRWWPYPALPPQLHSCSLEERDWWSPSERERERAMAIHLTTPLFGGSVR